MEAAEKSYLIKTHFVDNSFTPSDIFTSDAPSQSCFTPVLPQSGSHNSLVWNLTSAYNCNSLLKLYLNRRL